MDLFSMSTWALLVVLVVVIGGASALGNVIGRMARRRSAFSAEPLGAVQGALLVLVGLLLAFGLSMAVDRYEARRQLIVEEANAIGTAYLRAQLLGEPYRDRSMALLAEYSGAAVDLAHAVPGTRRAAEVSASIETLHGALWTVAREALEAQPLESAPRLYVEALNPMIDAHTSRVSSLENHVPDSVLMLLLIGGAVSVGALSLYVAYLGRGLASPVVTGLMVLMILAASFDLDRPQRGLIKVRPSALEHQHELIVGG